MFTAQRIHNETATQAVRCRAILFAAILALVSLSPSIGDAQEEPISAMNVRDLVTAEEKMRRFVAHIDAEHPPPKGQPLSNATSSGWCVVSGLSELTCQALLVHGATQISVHGPSGQVAGHVHEYNMQQRWAKVRTEAPVTSIGLLPALASPKEVRSPGMDIFALIHTEPKAGVLVGLLLEMDGLSENEGYIRSDLKLRGGMPVFDKYMRWVGISRSSIWDKDQTLLVPPEMTTNATVSVTVPTSTTTNRSSSRPWWAR